ncbi:MAG: Ros/MucR family transcriptional regulator [Caulobacteraceae bacterium]
MTEERDLMTMTADVVVAYVGANKIHSSDLAALVASVHTALAGAEHPEKPVEAAPTKLTPAQIRKSVTSDALISFVDGRPYKSLKRHLSVNGMTPEEYRETFGLPRDYPMVAPAHSAHRSALAKQAGLGNPRAAPAPEPVVEAALEPSPAPPAKRGRKPKAQAQAEHHQQEQRPALGIHRDDEEFT